MSKNGDEIAEIAQRKFDSPIRAWDRSYDDPLYRLEVLLRDIKARLLAALQDVEELKKQREDACSPGTR